MNQQPVPQQGLSPHIRSLQRFYWAVGLIGLFMPWVVRLVGYFSECITNQPTVSSYYYTSSRDLFVGSLFAIGILIICARIGDRLERLLFFLCGIGAFLIGLCPTTADYPKNIMEAVGAHTAQVYAQNVYVPQGPLLISGTRVSFHSVGVALLFGSGLILTGFVFVRNPLDPGVSPHIRVMRQRVYRWCAVVMLVCAVCLLIFNLPGNERLAPWTFYPESFYITAFGYAFLVKSQALIPNRIQGAFNPRQERRLLVRTALLPVLLCAIGLLLTVHPSWFLDPENCNQKFPRMPFNTDKERQAEQPWATDTARGSGWAVVSLDP
ncbi:hypothetical protein [Deinococcus sp. 12RED42]|uniref:hypothetical protein n=1 Tax=Deinococcus sp. 12RED42 TaxID=2745872 RepID=UPI001E3C4B5C|nr:hypothetical protein [Deinococcus sp. 12RED42]MCD0164934.1 hypothetical protein [Deinococcus sp. 12RED42]